MILPFRVLGNEIAVDPLLRPAIKRLRIRFLFFFFSFSPPIKVKLFCRYGSARGEDSSPLGDFLLVGGAALIVDALMERTNRAGSCRKRFGH